MLYSHLQRFPKKKKTQQDSAASLLRDYLGSTFKKTKQSEYNRGLRVIGRHRRRGCVTGVEVVEGRRWEAHGNANHSMSLAMSTETASFSAAPLSLVAGPVSTATVSRASNKSQGLDYSVWAVTSIHPSLHAASFPLYPKILPFKIKNKQKARVPGALLGSGICWLSPQHSPLSLHLSPSSRIWRSEVLEAGGQRTPPPHLQPHSVPVTSAR